MIKGSIESWLRIQNTM